jgi:hypothetical protein
LSNVAVNPALFDDGEIIAGMARIKEQDASIFKEANLTVLDNFSDLEVLRIGILAEELKALLDVAKKRQGDSLRKAG